jgi:alpha-glucosidase
MLEKNTCETLRLTDDWWRGAIIYQIYPRSFYDSNGDGIGDLPGITAKLDYIATLGVDGIWLCPFFLSPQRDFGYDVADYTMIDPIFGTLEDFDALLAKAHDLQLKVLIDQVWSHSSDQHAWFRQSQVAREGAYADFYVWADPKPDGTPPNNWLSVFGGSAWTWEPRRRQYYLHHFLPEQPALNLHNTMVVDHLLATGAFWLERGVDGFRLDAVDFMVSDQKLRDNQAKPVNEVPSKPFGMQHHEYDMLQPETMRILQHFRRFMDRYPGRVTLGEVSSQPGAFSRVRDYTDGDEHMHTAYTLLPMKDNFTHQALYSLLCEAADPRGWPSWGFSNHDTERAISRWMPADANHTVFAKLLFALLASLRGSICLYQGEELGLTEARLPHEALRDPFGITYWPIFKGRDGARTPMPWHEEAPHCGFSADMPWLPVPDDHASRAVDRQENDPSSHLNFIRDFIAWRSGQLALVKGDMEVLPVAAPLLGFIRRFEGQSIIAIFNTSGEATRMSLGDVSMPRVLHQSGCGGLLSENELIVPAYTPVFVGIGSAEV